MSIFVVEENLSEKDVPAKVSVKAVQTRLATCNLPLVYHKQHDYLACNFITDKGRGEKGRKDEKRGR